MKKTEKWGLSVVALLSLMLTAGIVTEDMTFSGKTTFDAGGRMHLNGPWYIDGTEVTPTAAQLNAAGAGTHTGGTYAGGTFTRPTNVVPVITGGTATGMTNVNAVFSGTVAGLSLVTNIGPAVTGGTFTGSTNVNQVATGGTYGGGTATGVTNTSAIFSNAIILNGALGAVSNVAALVTNCPSAVADADWFVFQKGTTNYYVPCFRAL